MKTTIERSVEITESPRLKQLRGMFGLKKEKTSVSRWEVNLPVEDREWSIGLIVGPSGCGKTTIARELFGGNIIDGFEWSAKDSLVVDFPKEMGIKEITGLLSSVGFSSPPSWCRPFAQLSNGEQFRVTLARALAESPDLVVIDEFTSVVDRTVAQIGSAAVAKAVRRSGRKLIAVACHYDIIDWLDPDWVYEPTTGKCHWRLERRRPEIELTVERVDRSAWEWFRHHHYLNHDLHKSASCFVGKIHGRLACFASAMFFAHPKVPSWREHRTVCLPDFQGVGIGNAVSELVAACFAATGKKYTSVTGHSAMIGHRQRSPVWHQKRKPSMMKPMARMSEKGSTMVGSMSVGRMTASFEYCGPADRERAVELGIVES